MNEIVFSHNTVSDMMPQSSWDAFEGFRGNLKHLFKLYLLLTFPIILPLISYHYICTKALRPYYRILSLALTHQNPINIEKLEPLELAKLWKHVVQPHDGIKIFKKGGINVFLCHHDQYVSELLLLVFSLL